MIPIPYLKIKKQHSDSLLLVKSFWLLAHELILCGFWFCLIIICFSDEAKLGLVNFYRKHLPAGLILLPLSTKVALLIPFLMLIACIWFLSSGTKWSFNRNDGSVIRSRYIFFGLLSLKKKWAFDEINEIRIHQLGKSRPYKLYLLSRSGKSILMDNSGNRRGLQKIAQQISILMDKPIH